MSPSIVANQGLASSELSLWSLFWNAHWIVQGVMLGLLICSVWVWAIAIDKTFLYARMRRAMDRFEQAFWSGQSLEELYKMLSAKPSHSMAALFVAAMREWNRDETARQVLMNATARVHAAQTPLQLHVLVTLRRKMR